MQELAEIEEQLWSYIDNSCSEAERIRMDENMTTSPLWQNTYHKLLSIHQQLQGITPEQPSMRFTKNLMEELAGVAIAPKINRYVNATIIKTALAACVLILAAFFGYVIGTADWSAQTATRGYLDKLNTPATKYMALFTIATLLLVLIDSLLRRNRQKQANL